MYCFDFSFIHFLFHCGAYASWLTKRAQRHRAPCQSRVSDVWERWALGLRAVARPTGRIRNRREAPAPRVGRMCKTIDLSSKGVGGCDQIHGRKHRLHGLGGPVWKCKHA